MSEPGVPDFGEKNEKMALAAADTSSCGRRSGSNDISRSGCCENRDTAICSR
jgi:hypothetical protein